VRWQGQRLRRHHRRAKPRRQGRPDGGDDHGRSDQEGDPVVYRLCEGRVQPQRPGDRTQDRTLRVQRTQTRSTRRKRCAKGLPGNRRYHRNRSQMLRVAAEGQADLRGGGSQSQRSGLRWTTRCAGRNESQGVRRGLRRRYRRVHSGYCEWLRLYEDEPVFDRGDPGLCGGSAV